VPRSREGAALVKSAVKILKYVCLLVSVERTRWLGSSKCNPFLARLKAEAQGEQKQGSRDV
jgi:hypothetical protein